MRHVFFAKYGTPKPIVMKRTEKEELELEAALERELNSKDEAKRTELDIKKKVERGVEIPQNKVHDMTDYRKGGKNIDPLNKTHTARKGNMDSGSGRDRAANRNNK